MNVERSRSLSIVGWNRGAFAPARARVVRLRRSLNRARLWRDANLARDEINFRLSDLRQNSADKRWILLGL